MDRNEMMERAEEIRLRDKFGTVEPEEFINFYTLKEDMYIDTENYRVHVVRFTPINPKDNRPMIINFHGGGFLKGRYDRDDLFCSKISSILNCEIEDNTDESVNNAGDKFDNNTNNAIIVIILEMMKLL